ncbi:BnaC01g40990D [Brassica napus]|uniref:BnaC01g40990D protein n=1 Tax=Brassica napus TaxID=3708 RepID=A0A078J8F2_BRANA|nr:BnaC01g40990D [Brassica napus]
MLCYAATQTTCSSAQQRTTTSCLV